MKRFALFAFALLYAASGYAADRPNFLWLTCEDISPYVGCYGFEQAQTPNLDKLADEGVRFTQAYVSAPVCAVTRSTILTGMHSSTLGTHQMRSRPQLPACIPAYPKLFREAGYYCTNNVKTDYNSNFEKQKRELWDDVSRNAHWKNRPQGKPFFAVFNSTITHESQLSAKAQEGYVKRKQIPEQPRINPADIKLPPYHPDLPEIRQDWARLHDLITAMDDVVGAQLQELQEAGLADDTIVFFYSDHGGMLSRSKRYIYDVGTRIPLIVRIPPKWRHLTEGKPGSVNDELVQTVDFAKTVLSLADIDVPELMQGRVFLGPDKTPPPPTLHFYRDRMGARYDFSRAVTDGRYYFIRNFMPHRPRGRDSRYGYSVQANWGAWERWYDKDPAAAGPIRSQFFLPKPAVELFDTPYDPWHVENLINCSECQPALEQLSKDLDAWMIATRDVGLIPEPLFYDLIGPGKPIATIYEYAQSDAYPIERILAAAKTASSGDESDLDSYLRMLQDKHPVIRHWGAYGIFRTRSNEKRVQQALRQMIADDEFAGNRVIAAQALGLCGDAKTAFETIMHEAKTTHDAYVFMFALAAFQYSHTNDRLTHEDWVTFSKVKPFADSPADHTGFEYAQRLVKDALEIWPELRKVD